jgi:hypothetical protein
LDGGVADGRIGQARSNGPGFGLLILASQGKWHLNKKQEIEMIEILLESQDNEIKKVINPAGFEFTSKLYSTQASWTEAGELVQREVRSVSEVNTFPAIGDQRLWVVTNLAADGQPPDLYINQSRVIAFQLKRELDADWYEMIPIALGITDMLNLTEQQCVFLADMNLRTVSQLSIRNDTHISLSTEQTTTNILRAIQHGLKLPELTIDQLPIELIGIFADEVGEKRNGTR